MTTRIISNKIFQKFTCGYTCKTATAMTQELAMQRAISELNAQANVSWLTRHCPWRY